MKHILFALLFFSMSASADVDVRIVTNVLANDSDGIAEDQTTAGADDLTLDGDLVDSGVAYLPEAQIISIESTGNLSGVTFTVTGKDADYADVSEDVTGPNNATVKTTNHFLTVSNIAVDGAVGTNVEVGALAADGMVTRHIQVEPKRQGYPMTLGVELSAGTGTFGYQYSIDKPNAGYYAQSYQHSGSWRDAVGLDPDTNTATGEDNIIAPIRAVRGLVTTGSTTGVYVFKALQGDVPQ
jgi:hypothetical protein